VTNAAVNIDGSALPRALSVNLANDAANVILTGGNGNDTLVGGQGDDFFDGGGGADAITGGGGNDTVSYLSSALAVGVDLTTGPGTGGATGDMLTGIENLWGSNQGDILTGNDGANTLSGLSGNDTLNGGGGDDRVDGGPGNDVAFLGTGNDVFQWDQGDGNDTVDGQDGVDRLDFNGASFAENIDISANGAHVRLTRDVDNVTMDLNDVEGIRFRPLGGADNIVINDVSGTDLVHSGVVVDLESALGSGVIDGQIDTVTGRGGNDALNIGVANGVIHVTGAAADVTILHADAADQVILSGGAGNDVIDASALPAGQVALTIDGGAGDDAIIGRKGPDLLL